MRPVAFIGHDDLLCRRVKAAVDGLATVSMLAPATIGTELAALQPVLVLLVLDVDRDPAFLADSFADLAAVVPDVAVVVLGDATNGGDVLAAVRAGSADFIDRDEAVAAMRDHLERRFATLTDGGHGEPGIFSVVFDARPGGGAGTFALGLAITRARGDGDALLIDCQSPASEAGTALDLPLTYSLVDAIRDAGRLDRTLLLSALPPHKPSGVRVLPLSLRADDNAGLSPDTVLKTLRVIRTLFRETIVNASEIREPAMLTTLAKWASTIYLVCPQKFTALADAKDLLLALPADIGPRTVLVVDDCSTGITLSPGQMLAALGLARLVTLPGVRDALVNGLNVGRPYLLAEPASAYALAIQEAADGLRPGNAAPQSGLIRTIARRLRGARA